MVNWKLKIEQTFLSGTADFERKQFMFIIRMRQRENPKIYLVWRGGRAPTIVESARRRVRHHRLFYRVFHLFSSARQSRVRFRP